MRLFAPGFLLGIFALLHFPFLEKLYLTSIFFIAACLLFFLKRYLLLRFIQGGLFGAVWVFCFLHLISSPPLPAAVFSKPKNITGVVVGLPKQSYRYASFYFETKSLDKHKSLLKLSWYFPKKTLEPGQRWLLQVKLKQPRGLANPGGFNFTNWAREKGIKATGYVRQSKTNNPNKLLGQNCLSAPISCLRYHILSFIRSALKKEKNSIAFIPALTVGYKTYITQADWRTLQRTGTNHLVAIAGLHIGFVAALLYLLALMICRLFPDLLFKMPLQAWAAIASFSGALFYSALAGFSLPTQRAMIMLAVVYLAIIFRRQLVFWQGYCLAIFLVLLINPLTVLSMSFWMSFTAVAAIIYGVTGRLKTSGKVKETVRVQWVVALGILPLSILFFHNASLISPLANAIAIPWVAFIVVPLSLLACLLSFVNFWLAKQLLLFAHWNMHWAWWFLSYAASLKIAAVSLSFISMGAFFCVCLALFLLISPRGFPKKYLAVFLLLPLFFYHRQGVAQGNMKFTLLDVGQGLSAVIQTKHKVLIYDAGPGLEGRGNAASSVIIPFLRHQGIRKIDKLIISHVDNDHVGGAVTLLKSEKIKQLITSSPSFFKNFKAEHCYAGQHWQWQDVRFKMLAPFTLKQAKRNNLSCVLQITIGKTKILLPGDVEKSTESQLVKQLGNKLKSNILVAPHHGSKTSSSWKFIMAVDPQYVLYPVGHQNRFKFPAKQVVERYKLLGAKQFSTAQCGAISFMFGAKHQNLQVNCFRK